jgi:5'(3')-deoxyribonucleotidase
LSKYNSLKPYSMSVNVVGYWTSKKEKLKQKFPAITDNDLLFCEGKEGVMIEMLGYKLGKTKMELLSIIAGLE